MKDMARITEPGVILCLRRDRTCSGTGSSLYDEMRSAWLMNGPRREAVKIALAHIEGRIVAVYVVNGWVDMGLEVKDSLNVGRRWAFNGHEAPWEIARKYLGKSVAKSRSVVRYVNLPSKLKAA